MILHESAHIEPRLMLTRPPNACSVAGALAGHWSSPHGMGSCTAQARFMSRCKFALHILQVACVCTLTASFHRPCQRLQHCAEAQFSLDPDPRDRSNALRQGPS